MKMANKFQIMFNPMKPTRKLFLFGFPNDEDYYSNYCKMVKESNVKYKEMLNNLKRK